MRRGLAAVLGAALGAAAACVPPPQQRRPAPPPAPAPVLSLPVSTAPAVAVSTAAALPPAPPPPPLRLLAPEEWPELKDELDRKSLAKAAAKSLAYLATVPEKQSFKVGDRDIAPGLIAETVRELLKASTEASGPADLRRRLQEGFDLYQSIGSDGQGKVVFSSYYQPVLPASPKETPKYRFPIYRKPPDMVDADLSAFNAKWKGEALLGRVEKGRLVPYFDRRDIDVRKVLKGRKLEVAWLANQFDRLDLHIQGSGILEYPGGKQVLAKFAATNSLPYKSVGLAVVGSGALTRAEISHQRLRQYLTEHPEGEAWLIAQNPRYTFFDIAPLPEDGEPFGTIQQSLTPGRSIAIDPKIIPLGAVAFFRAPMPQASRSGDLLGIFPTSRFALCQDTGGAILGPGRVDIYIGHGPQAKTSAVNQWSEGQLYILMRKLPPRDR